MSCHYQITAPFESSTLPPNLQSYIWPTEQLTVEIRELKQKLTQTTSIGKPTDFLEAARLLALQPTALEFVLENLVIKDDRLIESFTNLIVATGGKQVIPQLLFYLKVENSSDYGQHRTVLAALQKILTATEFEKIFQTHFLDQAKDSPLRTKNWLLTILKYPPALRTPFLTVFFDTANSLQQTVITSLKEQNYLELLTGFTIDRAPFSLERLFFSSNQVSLNMQDFYQLWHQNPFPDLSPKIENALGTGTAAFHKEAFLILKFEQKPELIAEPENFQSLVAALWEAEISAPASWQPLFDFLTNRRQEIVTGSNPPQTYWHPDSTSPNQSNWRIWIKPPL